MILTPFKCSARSGYFWKAKPMFVNDPVETSHAVLGGVAINALYIASRWSTSVTAGSMGCGSRVTPSSPDSPRDHQLLIPCTFHLVITVDIGGMHYLSYHRLCSTW